MPQFLLRLLPIKSLKGTLELKPHEDPFIDGLRGFSVVMVIAFHTLFAVHLAFKGQPEKFQAFLNQFPDWTHVIFGFDKAVDIFFMISAYLLGSSLMKQSQKGRVGIRTFYSHRIGRIYPLFLVALLIYGLPTGAYFLEVAWHNLLFIDNYTFTTIIPVGWSLSVEMQCYLLLPFLMIALFRTNHTLVWLLLLVLLSVVIRWQITVAHPEVYTTPFIDYLSNIRDPAEYMRLLYESTPARFGSFVIGLVWAHLEPSANKWSINATTANALWVLCFGTAVATLFFPSYVADAYYYQVFNETVNQAVIVFHRTIFALSMLGVVLLVRAKPNSGIMKYFRLSLSVSFWRPFSRLAFPAYLFHFPFIAIAWLLVIRNTQIETIAIPTLFMSVIAMIITSLLVLWFSLPLHYKIEKPGIAWGKRIGDRWLPNKPAD